MHIIWETGDYATVADDINCGDLAAKQVILDEKLPGSIWRARSTEHEDLYRPVYGLVREEWLKP